MELKELTKRIKKKFGTISSFCRCSGEDAYELQKLFTSERNKTPNSRDNSAKMEQLSLLVKNTMPSGDSSRISSETRAKVEEAITKEGGVKSFVEKHPKYSSVTIFQIIDGRRIRKTKLVQELIKHLGVNE